MNKYKVTFWVRVKRETEVIAESEDDAIDKVAEGNCGQERDIYEDFDDRREASAIKVSP